MSLPKVAYVVLEFSLQPIKPWLPILSQWFLAADLGLPPAGEGFVYSARAHDFGACSWRVFLAQDYQIIY